MSSALLLVTAAATGCGFQDETPETEKVSFEYFSLECLLGCSVAERALLVGTTESIVVDGDRADSKQVSVRSIPPDVASATLERICSCDDLATTGQSSNASPDEELDCAEPLQTHCDNRIRVVAHAAGTADLVMSDERGLAIAHATIRVAEPGRAVVLDRTTMTPFAAPISLNLGWPLSLEVQLATSDGTAMLASQGVVWAASGSALKAQDCTWGPLCNAQMQDYVATEVGTSTVTVNAGSSTAQIEVQVR